MLRGHISFLADSQIAFGSYQPGDLRQIVENYDSKKMEKSSNVTQNTLLKSHSFLFMHDITCSSRFDHVILKSDVFPHGVNILVRYR